ncbi:MAG TPA: iron-sulfur cluster assembly accessory protein [Coxiellaceae bacterium]|nr:MAG: hypothetical protein A3E81_07300 [Gammaproteobacteria bacterium RIFCSPHIGHO2_12_FULL_36_30]HLB57143.1 iron-sulfur cluster assembly accessory protein [Coxiellaceae bacterium]
MITLTAEAKLHIKKMLENKPRNAAFHLSIKKTGCSGYMYVPEIILEKKETDIEVRESDLLIYIDRNAMELIKGTQIDYVKKGLGSSQLVFNNPNAEGVCGCGESFQIRVK